MTSAELVHLAGQVARGAWPLTGREWSALSLGVILTATIFGMDWPCVRGLCAKGTMYSYFSAIDPDTKESACFTETVQMTYYSDDGTWQGSGTDTDENRGYIYQGTSYGSHVYLTFRTVPGLLMDNAGALYLASSSRGYEGYWIGMDIDLQRLVQCPFILTDTLVAECSDEWPQMVNPGCVMVEDTRLSPLTGS